MKLTVLVDNNTLIDRYYMAEPGVSYFIELDDQKILFDTGYSDLFMKNAVKMGIDLFDLDVIVLSHSHIDHTWGLQHLIQAYSERIFENIPFKRPMLAAHPSVFDRRFIPGLCDIGCLISQETANRYFDLNLTDKPLWLTPDLVFSGEINRTTTFEAQNPIGRIVQNGVEKDDFIMDDSSLAFRSSMGLVIISGCAHAGICNTVNQAIHICNEQKIADIIGGFHLLEPTREQLDGTVAYLSGIQPEKIHACHCTDLNSKIALSRAADLKEVGVGLELKY